MTSTPEQNDARSIRKRAGREASDWLIFLQDDPSDPDLRARFDQWLAADPVHAEAWAQTSEIMGFVDQAEPAHEGYWEDLPDARRTPRPRPLMPAISAIARPRMAFAAIAATVLLWLAIPPLLLRVEADHIAGTGEVERIALPDGSTVTLSAGSAIAADIGASIRDVRLLRGSALFEVAHDASRPFHVEAGGIRTTVLGTRFEVALQEDGGSVAVARGRVRVNYAKGTPPVSTELTAGQQIALATDKPAHRASVSPGNVAAWKDGQLVMSDRPARDVITALRPWYSGIIVATGPALDTKRLTSVYDLRDPASAFAALARVPGIRVRRITPWITTISVVDSRD